MKGKKTLLISSAMAAVLLVLAWAMPGPLARLTAEHWRKQLDTVPDDQADILLRQVAELGQPGIPVLAEAIGCRRESVARAAKRVLLEQLDHWKMLPPDDRSQRLAALAEALASRVERFGPTARADASELAGRVLLWPLDSDAVDHVRVIDCCEKVFQASVGVNAGMLTGPSRTGRQTTTTKPAPSTSHRQTTDNDSPWPDDMDLTDLGRLPGGGLPLETEPLGNGPRLEASTGRSEIPRVATAMPPPHRLPSPSSAQPLRRPDETTPRPNRPDELRTTPEVANRPSDRSSDDATAIRPLSMAAGNADLLPLPMGDLTRMETIDLMRQLRAEDVSRATAAEAELRRRGFAKIHIELARRLFDPNPTVRVELAHRLPGMPGIDAVTWLMWLCRDADPEVRRVAITLIATTGDPTLIEQVEQIARQDSDPRIQQQAERMAAQRIALQRMTSQRNGTRR